MRRRNCTRIRGKARVPRPTAAGDRMRRTLALSLAVLLAAQGCAVQPDYKRPPVELPAAWKESAQNPASAAGGNWWRIYADPALEALVAEALERNSDLARAAARVDEARALVAQAESAFYP